MEYILNKITPVQEGNMKLRIGKIRGLQQISTSEGVFLICALDHRNSLKKLVS